MAFFGSADSDQLVKQLRGQLAQKDFEIQTLINEQAKKDELFSETKRAKDDAVYKASAQTEQERAMKAERTLAKSIAELQNANIRLANLESTLNDANVRHKKDAKEMDRLQYELDTRADSTAANSRVQNTVSGLQDEIKSLKNQLQRTESEKESLENQVRLSGSSGIFGAGGFGVGHGGNGKEKATIFALENELQALRRENLKLMEQDRSNASASTPARPRTQTSFHPSPTPRSKRALSFSGGAPHPKIQALEAEIEHLRSQAMPGLDMKEVEKLRTDMETAKRHALKMENEKMAAERSIQREMDDIKSRLSDANDELQYLRALDGQSVQQELDNAKKAAKSERLALEQELQSRSDDLEKRKMDVRRLESRLSDVQDEVDRLRSASSSATQPDDKEVSSLRDAVESLKQQLETRTAEYREAKKRVETLENQLTQAPKSTGDPVATIAQAAKQQRAHQREIEDLQQAKEALKRHLAESEELVAERDAEIFELKRHIPLPSSNADITLDDSAAKDITDLGKQLAAKVEELVMARNEKAALEDRLQRVEVELEQANAIISGQRDSLADLREELEAKLSETEKKRDTLGERLNAQEQKCEGYERQIAEYETERKSLSERVVALSVNETEAESDREQIGALKERITEMEKRLTSMDTVERQLTETRGSLDELRNEKSKTDDELAGTRKTLADVRAAIDLKTTALQQVESEQQALVASHQRDTESRSATQKARMLEMQNQLDVMRDQLEESDAELGHLQDELAKATAGSPTDEDKAALAAASSERDRLRGELDRAAQQAGKLDAQVIELTNRIESLSDDLEESQRLVHFADIEHSILAQAVSAARTAEQISSAQLDRLRIELEEAGAILTEERETASSDRQESQETINRLRDDFAALQLEHEDLVDSKTQLESALEAATSEAQRKENDLRIAREQVNNITSKSTDGVVIELRRNIQELEARVSRRNQLVAAEQAKTKKVEMNLEMATQDIEELEAEIVRLRDAVSVKEASLVGKDVEMSKARDEYLERIDLLENQLALSQTAADALRSEVQQRNDDHVKVVAQLAQSDNDRQTDGLRAIELRQELERAHLAKVEALTGDAEQQCKRLDAELSSARLGQLSACDSLNTVTVQLIRFSREISSLEISRDEALRKLRTEVLQNQDLKSEVQHVVTEAETASSRFQVRESDLQEALDGLNQDLRESEERCSKETQQVTLLAQQIKGLEEQVRSSSLSLEEKDNMASSAREEVVALRAEATSLRETNIAQTMQKQQLIEKHAREVASIRVEYDQVSLLLAQAVSDVERLGRASKTAEDVLAERSQSLAISEKALEALSIERDDALKLIDTLREEVTDLSAQTTDAQSRLQFASADVGRLKEEVSQKSEQAARLREQNAEAEARLQQLSKQVETQQLANEQLNRSLAEHSRDRFEIAAERDDLVRHCQDSNQQLAEEQKLVQELNTGLENAQSENERLSSDLQVMTKEVESLSVRYQKAHGLATALTADASRLEDKLREANKKLAAAEAIAAQMTEEKALLAGPSQTDSDDKARLEQALDGMQTELEEQMEQVRIANKAKAQLQRKVDKLERKVKSLAETPVSTEVPISVLAPQQVIHNQEAARTSPVALTGQKRLRDDDPATKKISAGPEAVIAPSPFELARTPIKRVDVGANRLAFTPTRHNLNPNMGTIPRSPYGRLATGDENAFPVMAMMRGKFSSGMNQQTPGH